MNSTPALFDRAAIVRNRTRARNDALFLHRTALGEVQDRLSMVNRTFKTCAIVTPFPEIWSAAFPHATFVTDDDVLALNDAKFDLIIHAMCLHWSNDPVGQVIQCRRALVDDGLFLAVLPGANTLAELRAVLVDAESHVSGGVSPRVAPMAEIKDLGSVLQRAGLNLPVADSVDLTVEYRDMYHLMRDLRAMGETNAMTQRLRQATARPVFEYANRLYAERFSLPTGRLGATFQVVVLTGWSPDASQPKPLRPGSASARLADALGASETKLSD